MFAVKDTARSQRRLEVMYRVTASRLDEFDEIFALNTVKVCETASAKSNRESRTAGSYVQAVEEIAGAILPRAQLARGHSGFTCLGSDKYEFHQWVERFLEPKVFL